MVKGERPHASFAAIHRRGLMAGVGQEVSSASDVHADGAATTAVLRLLALHGLYGPATVQHVGQAQRGEVDAATLRDRGQRDQGCLTACACIAKGSCNSKSHDQAVEARLHCLVLSQYRTVNGAALLFSADMTQRAHEVGKYCSSNGGAHAKSAANRHDIS